MAPRDRTDDEGAERFGWGEGDVIPLEDDEQVEFPPDYDQGPGAE